MKKPIITLLFFICTLQIAAAGIGTWKAYMAYHDITEVEKAGSTLFVLASTDLYAYDTADNSLQTFDKVGLLSDCEIAHIAWNAAARRLVIVYENANIDLMDANFNVTNVSDYYSKSMTEDKTVNDIYVHDRYAYLSTAFGILKLDVQNAEIADTYNLGLNVYYSYIEGGYLYAASYPDGLYRASLSANLLDKANWNRVGDYTQSGKQIDPELLALAQTLTPGGPKYNNFGFLRFHGGSLYSVGGGYSVEQDLNRPGCVQVLTNGEWTMFEDNLTEKTNGNYFFDLSSVDVNPKDESVVFAGARTGLFEFKDGKFVKHYSYDNSALRPTFVGNKGYVAVQGLKYDDEGNLWCVNSMSNEENLLKLSADYKWTSHNKTMLKALNNVSQLMFDSQKLLWMVNNNWVTPSLYCYQPSTDAINGFTTFVNEDNTTVEVGYVRCVAEDKEGNIWIGTHAGPLMLEPDQFGSDNPVFQQIKIPRNDGTNYADYLLAGVDITCMAVDGGGRKWFGTNGNGVYLISSDNMTQISHFLASETPLLSDNIESIAINEQSGEVFFGTDKGLCSYQSDASAAVDEMNKHVTYAYPNPVRPDYTGSITIVGLTYNADVKIVTSNGSLVAEGKSNGGTFVWDGCDTRGRRVASGVYMVVTAKADGSKGTVCKIAVIN